MHFLLGFLSLIASVIRNNKLQVELTDVDVGGTTISGVLDPDHGGTGVNNSTNALIIPETGTAALKTGTPTANNVASWNDGNTVKDAGFAASDVARLSQSQTFTGRPRLSMGFDVNSKTLGFAAYGSASVSTSATTLLTLNSRMNLVMVYGKSGSDYFCDLVLVMTFSGRATAFQSITFGSPAARTYDENGAAALTLAMASGTYNVQAVTIANLRDP